MQPPPLSTKRRSTTWVVLMRPASVKTQLLGSGSSRAPARSP
ncbi:hypothetical protein MGSAQ_002145 [marine sediment metagenome]|uniref:Uncharacterized protein n=1 Tax=marine sediment metagenome TaxID=412755 RepID=A0A1B6NSA7_9ZZZZ